MSKVETVSKCCKHEDCIYRRHLSWTPYCDYIGIEKKPRGCDISKCDKYKPGKKTRPRLQRNYDVDWDWELYDIQEYYCERRDE